jgi:hypothetical protein
MTSEFNEIHFESWLFTNREISKKGARDVISRLKRSSKIVPLQGHENLSSYEGALLKELANSAIPQSSQASMLRSVRLYFKYKG